MELSLIVVVTGIHLWRSPSAQRRQQHGVVQLPRDRDARDGVDHAGWFRREAGLA